MRLLSGDTIVKRNEKAVIGKKILWGDLEHMGGVLLATLKQEQVNVASGKESLGADQEENADLMIKVPLLFVTKYHHPQMDLALGELSI
jgi:hypothetical protein